MPPTPGANLARLRADTHTLGGDVRRAVRMLTGESTAATARRLSLDRASVQLCLKGSRRYVATRRMLELGLHIPPYSLDPLLDRDGEETMSKPKGA